MWIIKNVPHLEKGGHVRGPPTGKFSCFSVRLPRSGERRPAVFTHTRRVPPPEGTPTLTLPNAGGAVGEPWGRMRGSLGWKKGQVAVKDCEAFRNINLVIGKSVISVDALA